jgi:hypothetical protein
MLHNPGYGPPFRRRRGRGMLTHAMMTVPAPGPQSAPLAGGEQAIVNKIKPGLVIINTALQYNSETAAGTGIVINADGLVLTNSNVIDHATKITATAASTGTTYTATVVGYDKTGDIALIQLRRLGVRSAASVTECASTGSVLRPFPVANTRTCADSLGGTSKTISPSWTRRCARCLPMPLQPSTAQIGSANIRAAVSICA